MLALAAKGAKVVIDYVADEQATEELERQIAGLGEMSVGVEADVSKVEDLQRMIDTAVSTYGRLDVMVNNAGIETRTSVLDTTEVQFEKVMAVNLKSAFFGTQLAAKQMIKQGGGGRIINMTSVHEDWPMPGNTPYCLSKGGMRMLTRTAGVELAPHNVLVVGVGPGAVNTPINAQTVNDPAALAEARQRHPDRPPGRARGDRVAWWPSWPVMAPATSRRRRSSPTAGSCRAAPGSDPAIAACSGRLSCPGRHLARRRRPAATSSSPTLGTERRLRKMW